ncbi:hypothetical protein GCM10017673_44540 [Streptosporangium violaceochromogenes]|nr:hypothetical protein GCM10017673_44540 [Streptosporangium violaceochromogenes]
MTGSLVLGAIVGALSGTLDFFQKMAGLVGGIVGESSDAQAAGGRVTLYQPYPGTPEPWKPCQPMRGEVILRPGKVMVVGVRKSDSDTVLYRYQRVDVSAQAGDGSQGRSLFSTVVAIDPKDTSAGGGTYQIEILEVDARTVDALVDAVGAAGGVSRSSWPAHITPPRSTSLRSFSVLRSDGIGSC